MIEKYRDGDGYTFDGCYYDDAASLVMTGILGFCGCGNPEDAADFVAKGLEHINELTASHENNGGDYPEWIEWHKEWTTRGDVLFGSHGGAMFFYYWAADKDLTEHGGAVPGWLSDKGHEILAALKGIIKEAESCGK